MLGAAIALAAPSRAEPAAGLRFVKQWGEAPLVLDGASGTSSLQVLDASRIDTGAIARCHFDQAIPFGFHGIWDPAR